MPRNKFKKGNIPHNRIAVHHDGIDYESMHHMAETFRTSSELIRYYLRTGKPFAGQLIKKI